MTFLLEDDVVLSPLHRETMTLAGVNTVQVSKAKRVASKLRAMFYRFWALHDYILPVADKYTLVALTDLDIVFQRNYFDCFGKGLVGLAAFAENPNPKIGDEVQHVGMYKECEFMSLGGKKVNGKSLLLEHGKYDRICAGFSLGDPESMLKVLRHMSAAMNQSVCNDQIVLNILIYGDLMKDVSSIAVYSQYNGPVKILDVGYLSDAWGNVYNEDGNKYCVLHQYRADRNPQYGVFLRGRYPYSAGWKSESNPIGNTFPRGRRVKMEDIRFPNKEHKSVNNMHKYNLTAAGELSKTAPIPQLKGFIDTGNSQTLSQLTEWKIDFTTHHP